MQTQAGQHSQLGSVSFLNKGFGSLQKAWHSDDDVFIRREILLQITKLIQKNGSGLENKVPGIINEVEMALYLNAASKEEYGDLNTLELRIHTLILRARNGQKSAQYGTQQGSAVNKLSSPSFPAQHPGFTAPNLGYSAQAPSNFPSLGTGGFLSSNGPRVVSNTSVPSGYDSGSIGSAGFNMYLRGPAIGQQGSTPSGLCESGLENKGHFMSGIGSIPRMIPTPGLNIRSNEVPYNLGGMGFSNPMDSSFDKLKQHMLSTGRRGDSSASSNVMLPKGVLCNSSTKHPNAKVGLTHAPYQHHINQQKLCTGITEGNMYSSEVGDARSLYNSVTHLGSTLKTVGSSSLVEAPSSSIPGLFDGQHSFHLSDSLQSFPRSQSNESLQSTLQQQQKQQKQSGSLLVSNRCSEFENNANLFHADSSPPPPTLPDENLLATFMSQSQPGRSIPAAAAHGIHEPNCVEKEDQGVSRNLLDPPKLHHHCQLGGNIKQHEHSEHACQANSADTGQSEVVSNDDGLVPGQVKEVGSSSLLQFMKRQQWLLILFWHVSRCLDSDNCAIAPCKDGREAWEHITSCRMSLCPQPRCLHLKYLLSHHQKCRSSKCAICSPVRLHIRNQIMASRAKARNRPPMAIVKESACNEVESPPMKRVKVEVDVSKAPQKQQQSMSTVESQDQASCRDTLSTPKAGYCKLLLTGSSSDSLIPNMERAKGELFSVETNSSCESSMHAGMHEDSLMKSSSVAITMLDSVHAEQNFVQQDTGPLKPYMSHGTLAVALSQKTAQPFEKPMKPKISGLSYIEHLSPPQIRQHISSLRKWTGQSKGKAERNQAMEHHMSASACSACAVETLYFDPIPVFCTQCGCRIKRNATYYSAGSGENGLNFCGPCFNAIKSEVFETDGIKIQKSMLGKKKNDEQRVEGWVECDKCSKWQHQICVLFNARINKERSEYVCPECCIAEMESGQRVPWPVNSVLGAKDLSRTVLSDHVEERLARRLEQERTERARSLGKPVEEVPTAEGLVVRVISSVDKKLEVRPRFLELFQQETYPKDFLYKSKMLMLFQKIEGVEVCLFGMYVQEFGADCPQPNRRHVYLSYLDSVKYFRPDVKTTNGEALRTFVYHEILIAYLDYCKKRGFSSCYIWACPPLKGDDYILYCHPEIQKTPKTDKLRDWYLSMIAKSKKENIVVANKNLYDYFFTSNGESKAKVSAARLPYFDGDYWPGAAEDILQQLQQDEEGPNSLRRGRVTKLATKRTTKTSTHAELAGNVSRDMQLMHKLGQSIVGMKEDFMMVHLHHACSHCHEFITSGHRWFCQQCAANFQLCSGCHEEHQKLDEEERHPAGKKECHPLVMEEVEVAPASTVDKDEIMESELFDNRHAFLNLCQGNQYQYDTLRRAKHSSMMVLYHLHNPDAPAFIASCSVCHNEMEPAQGWKCKVCSDFDVCSSCYSSSEVQRHPHKLVARTTAADDSAKQRMEQLRAMLEVLAHASKCRDASCQYEKCRNIKSLFRHGNSCTKRAGGGCSLCKRMWFLLQCHARSCKETICSVPRCMDLKKHFRRLQLQQESRRRAAVNEMMRQRVAEQSGSLS